MLRNNASLATRTAKALKRWLNASMSGASFLSSGSLLLLLSRGPTAVDEPRAAPRQWRTPPTGAMRVGRTTGCPAAAANKQIYPQAGRLSATTVDRCSVATAACGATCGKRRRDCGHTSSSPTARANRFAWSLVSCRVCARNEGGCRECGCTLIAQAVRGRWRTRPHTF